MMVPDLMIHFTLGTVWEARLAVSHTLGENKDALFTQKVISTDH